MWPGEEGRLYRLQGVAPRMCRGDKPTIGMRGSPRFCFSLKNIRKFRKNLNFTLPPYKSCSIIDMLKQQKYVGVVQLVECLASNEEDFAGPSPVTDSSKLRVLGHEIGHHINKW